MKEIKICRTETTKYFCKNCGKEVKRDINKWKYIPYPCIRMFIIIKNVNSTQSLIDIICRISNPTNK